MLTNTLSFVQVLKNKKAFSVMNFYLILKIIAFRKNSRVV